MKNLKISTINELIDFVNREDVSVSDAEKVIKKCFPMPEIDFSEGNKDLPTKAELINRINEFSKPLTAKEIERGLKIYWH